jgi:hypothetical protein
MKQRINALKSTLEQQLQQLEKGMKKWMEEKSVPQPTVKQEDLHSLVRECVQESALVTNTPASAVHGKFAVQKGIYQSVAQFIDDSSRVETLLEG